MKQYTTETGYYVLRDADGKIGGKANVPSGTHNVPDWVDLSQSFDVESHVDLDSYSIHEDYLPDKI